MAEANAQFVTAPVSRSCMKSKLQKKPLKSAKSAKALRQSNYPLKAYLETGNNLIFMRSVRPVSKLFTI